MTVLEAVKRSKTTPMMFKDAIAVAQAALVTPEVVLWAHTGNVTLDAALGGPEKGLKPGVTVVTSHRLLFVYGVLGNHFTRQLSLSNIQIAEAKHTIVSSSLSVSGPEGSMVIEGNPKTIPELKAALDDAMSTADDLTPLELPTDQIPVPPTAVEAPPEEPAPAPAAAALDLEPYFRKFYPSRMKAAKALERDTKLDPKQCKDLIETYFTANLARVPMPATNDTPDLKHLLNPQKAALEDRMKELDRQGIAYCPKCASTGITARKRGFSIGKGLAGSLISPSAGLLAGAIGANKTECVCLKCGHTWKP